MPATPSFAQALVERIASALPALDKKPRWVDGIRDLPATLKDNSIFLWSATERAEQPRLLNSDQQMIFGNINILIVLAKSPRPSDKETENINNFKQNLRKTLQGWIPPRQNNQQFFPCTLLSGAPVTALPATQEGKKLWLETIQFKHIATKDTTTISSPTL